jgi:hypothetical protein
MTLGGATLGSSTLAMAGTATNTNQAAILSNIPNLTFSSGTNVTEFGQLNNAQTTVSGGTSLTSISAFFQNNITMQSAATLSAAIGFRARIQLSGASASGTITNDAAAELAAPSIGTSGTPTLTISSHKGLWVRNQGISGTGITATASYGAFIDAQSGSSTNFALWYDSANPTIIQASGCLSVGVNTDCGASNILANGYVQTGTTTVASLPACNAGRKGARYFVTDSNATTFHTTVAGGGANNVGVTCDGTNWYISANDNAPWSKVG